LLILAHAFFVAAEFGLVAVDRSKIETMAEEGHKRATRTLAALRTLSFQLSGAQLGITITSLLVGFLIEPAIAPLLEPLLEAIGVPESSTLGISIAIALFAATTFEMVVAELVPKNLAIARPMPTAFATASPLRAVNTLLKPFIYFLNSAANASVRLIGIEPKEEMSDAYSLEELQILIRSSREGGALDEEEFALLARSITFRKKTAADILVPRTSVHGLPKDASAEELMKEAVETGHSRFPVYVEDLDEIVGIAHVKDGYAFPPERRASVPLEQIMRELLVVPESRSLALLLADMRRLRQQLVVVVDEYGGTAGIITLEDLLEEIVGEIEDEYDSVDQPSPAPQPEGVFVVSGMLHQDEVAEQSGFEMPEGDYDTFAGFLLTLFDRIPEAGDHVAYDGWEFKVVEMEDRRIAKVLLVAPRDQEATQ